MRRQTREDGFIRQLVAGFNHNPGQLNHVHESDAELIRFPGTTAVLAVTVDQIVEEVRTGLYEDPFLLGWMTVTASASDLAAVGAKPLGMVIGQTFPPEPCPLFLNRLQKGIAEASAATRLPILGGDTAYDTFLSTSGTAFGLVPEGKPLTRRGAKAGDHLLATGLFGLGSVFAWCKQQEQPVPAFRPRARMEAGQLVRRFASAATDTSDGFLASCDLILPREGLDLELREEAIPPLHPAARRLAQELSVPEWLLLAGPHGEFELIIAVPGAEIAPLHQEARARGIPLVDLGEFRPGPGVVRFPHSGFAVDPSRVRDLHPLAAKDPRAFMHALSGCAQALPHHGTEAHHAHP